jgi:hypothetical protein
MERGMAVGEVEGGVMEAMLFAKMSKVEGWFIVAWYNG